MVLENNQGRLAVCRNNTVTNGHEKYFILHPICQNVVFSTKSKKARKHYIVKPFYQINKKYHFLFIKTIY